MMDPPPELEERILAGLRTQGLVGAPPARPRYWILPLWAASLLIALALGRRPAPVEIDLAQATHVLWIESDAEPTAADEASRVSEYGAWARERARTGELIAGERLDTTVLRLTPGGGPIEPRPIDIGTDPSGFFLLHAESDEHALRIAQSCPHLAHGGSVRVRAIAR
jgi:hypothetical protein